MSLPATKRPRDLDVPGGALKKAERGESDAEPTSASGKGSDKTGVVAPNAKALNKDPDEGRKE